MVPDMASIEVTHDTGNAYSVTVTEAGSSSRHEVTAEEGDVARFGRGCTPEALIAASFRFLLDREPKESILPSFDLSIIERYFPEYPSRIGDYL